MDNRASEINHIVIQVDRTVVVMPVMFGHKTDEHNKKKVKALKIRYD